MHTHTHTHTHTLLWGIQTYRMWSALLTIEMRDVLKPLSRSDSFLKLRKSLCISSFVFESSIVYNLKNCVLKKVHLNT